MHYNRPKKRFQSHQLGFHLSRQIAENKKILFFCFFFLLFGLLTGIFVTISSRGYVPYISTYSLQQFAFGNLASFGLLISRMFSYIIVLLVIYVASFHKLLIPLSFFAIAYRAYLLGVYTTMLIMFYGFSGAFTAFLILLPCQLATLILMCVFVCLSVDFALLKKFGNHGKGSLFGKLLIVLLLLTVINILETLLLKIFSGNVFLVL